MRSAQAVMDRDALHSARAIRQPIRSNDDIANAFDGLTYDKGAAVLAMFEGYAGADAFREGVRRHMRRFAHGTADARDFMESLAQGTRKPEIVPAMESFLNQPGVPLITVKTACTARDLEVTISQSPFGARDSSDTRAWNVPLPFPSKTLTVLVFCSLTTASTLPS
jgi:alanyl aminopeptidase